LKIELWKIKKVLKESSNNLNIEAMKVLLKVESILLKQGYTIKKEG